MFTRASLIQRKENREQENSFSNSIKIYQNGARINKGKELFIWLPIVGTPVKNIHQFKNMSCEERSKFNSNLQILIISNKYIDSAKSLKWKLSTKPYTNISETSESISSAYGDVHNTNSRQKNIFRNTMKPKKRSNFA